MEIPLLNGADWLNLIKKAGFVRRLLKYMEAPDLSCETHPAVQRLVQYGANVILLCGAIIFYSNNYYYIGFLRPETLLVLKCFIIIYVIFGLIDSLFIHKKLKYASTGYCVFYFIINYIIFMAHPEWKKAGKEDAPKIAHCRRALLFAGVKFFFLPLMINFMFSNIQSLSMRYKDLREIGIAGDDIFYIFNMYIYPLLFSFLFSIDTLIFMFGYMVESDKLGNRVRSVEPTLFGWVVALICYPPFNTIPDKYMVWPATDFPVFQHELSTFLLRILIIALYIIYVWASLALGMKASNLTNRGIVSRGPYRFVRHPAYISKNLAWWLSTIPVLSFNSTMAMAFWSLIYYLRAKTEERHLLSDSDYQEYYRKVRFKFIPYIW